MESVELNRYKPNIGNTKKSINLSESLQRTIDLEQRAISDGAVTENRNCTVNSIPYTVLKKDPNLVLTPSAFKAGSLLSIIPNDGTADFDVVRATTAWYRDSDGLLKEASANVPRFQFNTDASFAGLLVEPQRTNLVESSYPTNSSLWIKFNNGTGLAPVITEDDELDVRGLMKASRVQMSLDGGTAFADRTLIRPNRATMTVGLDYHFYFFIKAKSIGEVGKVINIRIEGTTSELIGDNVTLTNDWVYHSFLFTCANATVSYIFQLRGTLGTSNSADFLLCGVGQSEGTETSPIFTEGTILTRNEDVIDVTTPSGVTEIVETFSDGTTNTETTIPATYQLPQGEIKSIVMT
jgi:hypothetical protein